MNNIFLVDIDKYFIYLSGVFDIKFGFIIALSLILSLFGGKDGERSFTESFILMQTSILIFFIDVVLGIIEHIMTLLFIVFGLLGFFCKALSDYFEVVSYDFIKLSEFIKNGDKTEAIRLDKSFGIFTWICMTVLFLNNCA